MRTLHLSPIISERGGRDRLRIVNVFTEMKTPAYYFLLLFANLFFLVYSPAFQNVRIDARKIAAKASIFVDSQPPKHPYFHFSSHRNDVHAHSSAEPHCANTVEKASHEERAACLTPDAASDAKSRHIPPSLPCIAEGCRKVLSGGMDKLRRHIRLVHKDDKAEMHALLGSVAKWFSMRQGRKAAHICPKCNAQVFGSECVLRQHLKMRCKVK